MENNGIPSKPNICAGMIFLNNTVATRKVWAEVTKQYEECRAMTECQQDTEQSILSKILKSRGKLNISWTYFPIDHVFSGKWYRDETLRYWNFEGRDSSFVSFNVLGKEMMHGPFTSIGWLEIKRS